MQLSNAGNVVIPSIKVLLDLGYKITKDPSTDIFRAEKDGNVFTAEDPVALLGLVKLFELRGKNWRVSDKDLDDIGNRYGLL